MNSVSGSQPPWPKGTCSPAATFNGTSVIVAQAIVLPAAIASADAAVATAVDNLEASNEDLDFDGEGHA